MSFNADKFVATQPPFVLSVGGRTWTARLIGAPALERFHSDFARLSAIESERLAGKPPRRRVKIRTRYECARVKLCARLLRRVFPRKLSDYWRGDAALALLSQPPTARDAGLTALLHWLAGAPAAANVPSHSSS